MDSKTAKISFSRSSRDSRPYGFALSMSFRTSSRCVAGSSGKNNVTSSSFFPSSLRMGSAHHACMNRGSVRCSCQTSFKRSRICSALRMRPSWMKRSLVM